MRRSTFAALAIACLLAVPPLALKVSRYRSIMTADPSREARVAAFLASNAFSTTREILRDPLFLIHARRGSCTMDLREVAPQGYDQSAVKSLAAGRRLFYVDNGVVFAEQPAWRTWGYLHLRRFVSFMGWSLPKRTTFAVMSSGDCGDLNWSDLASPTIGANPDPKFIRASDAA